jgi:LPXTG-site transpeptidase (sortase) family protein
MFRQILKQNGLILAGVMLVVMSLAGIIQNRGSAESLDESTPAGPLIYPTVITLAPPRRATETPQVQKNSASPSPVQDGGTYLVPLSPRAKSTVQPEPFIPDRIKVPAIGLDAPVVLTAFRLVNLGGKIFEQWQAPMYFAAGWLPTSAGLGVPGNTVLDGHHNVYGKVFERLIDLNPGDSIQLSSGNTVFQYIIIDKQILPEKDEPLSVRLENAHWLLPSDDERLTLVTCWPSWSNTHRLFIVAKPIQGGK